MNEVQIELKERLRQGLTQIELAGQLGLHHVHLSQVIRGAKRPGPKVLKALGMRAVTVYEHIVPRAQKPRKEPKPPKSAQVGANNQSVKSLPISECVPQSPLLTAERVQVAMLRGLNPGKQWEEFLAAGLSGADLDHDWLQWCTTRGNQPDLIEERPFAAPLGQGDAVILKAPDPNRVDRRSPVVISQREGSMQSGNFIPPAGNQAIVEATRPDPGSFTLAEIARRG